jgi:hypothetical protein
MKRGRNLARQPKIAIEQACLTPVGSLQHFSSVEDCGGSRFLDSRIS